MPSGYLDEIFEQPEALRRCSSNFSAEFGNTLQRVRQRLDSGRFDKIVLTGMGASLHGCYPLYLFLSEACSSAVVLWDASELVHFAPRLLTERTLLIAVSQSGESAELRRIVEGKDRPGIVVSVTNDEANTLARWADVPLLTKAGTEATVSNKTYTTGLAVLHLLGSALVGREVDAARQEILDTAAKLETLLRGLDEQTERLADQLAPIDFLAFVGRGPSLASARAGSLITQEASKLPCAAYSGGGFRHGPLELVRPGFRAVIFEGGSEARLLNQRLAKEIYDCGGRALLLSPGATERTVVDDMHVMAIPEVASSLLPIPEIVPVQLLTIPLARAKGHEPAMFERASKVTAVE